MHILPGSAAKKKIYVFIYFLGLGSVGRVVEGPTVFEDDDFHEGVVGTSKVKNTDTFPARRATTKMAAP